MALAAWMATVAKDIGRLGLTFTVGAAIVTVGFSVAMATGMRALLWLIHGLHAPDSKIKLSALRFGIVYTSFRICVPFARLDWFVVAARSSSPLIAPRQLAETRKF
jgi:hypothetical protein